ncbi:MAG: SAM-dependent methyltransferase, partial [Longicatena sp.]
MNQVASNWKDYECLDGGNGEKLERWKDIILRRPDPAVIWSIDEVDNDWKNPHAHYHRSKS